MPGLLTPCATTAAPTAWANEVGAVKVTTYGSAQVGVPTVVTFSWLPPTSTVNTVPDVGSRPIVRVDEPAPAAAWTVVLKASATPAIASPVVSAPLVAKN